MVKTSRHLALVASVAIMLTACGGGDPTTDAAAATVRVTATDDGAGGEYRFELPGTLEAGTTRIELTNTGGEVHHAQLFRLHPGVTMDDLRAALGSADPTALFEVGEPVGGTGAVDPGATSSAEAVADLTEGTYALLCFVEDADGVPHLARGMVASFEVTAASEPTALGEADGTVELRDFAFGLPDELDGRASLEVTNRSGAEPHEFNLMRLAPGASFQDVLGLFGSEAPPDGPPLFSFVGGVNAIAPGASQRLVLDLEAGTYIAICFIPSFDPANEGRTHAELGMVQEIRVTSGGGIS